MSVLEGIAVLAATGLVFVVSLSWLFIRIERMGSRPRPPERTPEPHRALSGGSVIEATHRPAQPVAVATGRAALPAVRR